MELVNYCALYMQEQLLFLCIVFIVSMITFAGRVWIVHKLGKVLKLFPGNKIHTFPNGNTHDGK